MSAFNINDFKNQFTAGGVRPNLFKVQVAGIDEKLLFTCRAASVPAMTVGNIDVSYQGRKVKLAGDRTFAEWQITVYNDEDLTIRKQFEVWNNLLNLHAENVRAGASNIDGGFPNSYKRDCTVYQFDKKGNQISDYNLVGAYPSEVGAMEVAWDTNDSIQEFTVTFQYDYFTSNSAGVGIV